MPLPGYCNGYNGGRDSRVSEQYFSTTGAQVIKNFVFSKRSVLFDFANDLKDCLEGLYKQMFTISP